jgi:hypothetical protein
LTKSQKGFGGGFMLKRGGVKNGGGILVAFALVYAVLTGL